MAVADLGVAIRPRNRRRFTKGAVGVCGIAVMAAAIMLLAQPSKRSGPASSSGYTRVSGAATFVTERLVYGMSKQQVLRRVGRPAKTVGACWQYNENLKIRDGQNTLNAERVCFLGGNYSYSYSETDGKWFYPDGYTGRVKLPGGA